MLDSGDFKWRGAQWWLQCIIDSVYVHIPSHHRQSINPQRSSLSVSDLKAVHRRPYRPILWFRAWTQSTRGTIWYHSSPSWWRQHRSTIHKVLNPLLDILGLDLILNLQNRNCIGSQIQIANVCTVRIPCSYPPHWTLFVHRSSVSRPLPTTLYGRWYSIIQNMEHSQWISATSSPQTRRKISHTIKWPVIERWWSNLWMSLFINLIPISFLWALDDSLCALHDTKWTMQFIPWSPPKNINPDPWSKETRSQKTRTLWQCSIISGRL